MGLLGWLRFRESQFRSIIFMLRHMPSIYSTGVHIPISGPYCMVPSFGRTNADTSTLPVQPAHPSHKASGFTSTLGASHKEQNKASIFQPPGSSLRLPFSHGTDMPQGSGCGMHGDAVAMTFGVEDLQLQSLH